MNYFWIRRLADNAIVIAQRYDLSGFIQWAAVGNARALLASEVDVIGPVGGAP